MGRFQNGDRVVNANGYTGVVLSSMESISIKWDSHGGVTGTWPADQFEMVPRKFKPGVFVRIESGDEFHGNVGIVFEDDGGDEESEPYCVALYDIEQSEEFFSASELIPWKPLVGERVVTTDDEDEYGTVVGYDNDILARIKWDLYPGVQTWAVEELEPADEEPVKVGDSVVYNHPMFAKLEECTVIGVGDGFLNVVFDSGFLPPGNYVTEVFQKAA